MSPKNPFRVDFTMMQFPPGMHPTITMEGFQLEGDEKTGEVEVPNRLVKTAEAHGLTVRLAAALPTPPSRK